jgi:hypothetical protein
MEGVDLAVSSYLLFHVWEGGGCGVGVCHFLLFGVCPPGCGVWFGQDRAFIIGYTVSIPRQSHTAISQLASALHICYTFSLPRHPHVSVKQLARPQSGMALLQVVFLAGLA